MARSALKSPAAGAAAAAACRDCACVRTPAGCSKQCCAASCRACACTARRPRQCSARQACRPHLFTAAAGLKPCRLRPHRCRKRRRAQRQVQSGMLHLSTSPPQLSRQPSRQHGHPGQHMQVWPLYTFWNHVTPPPPASATAAPPRPACAPGWCTAATQRMAVDWPRAGHGTVAG